VVLPRILGDEACGARTPIGGARLDARAGTNQEPTFDVEGAAHESGPVDAGRGSEESAGFQAVPVIDGDVVGPSGSVRGTRCVGAGGREARGERGFGGAASGSGFGRVVVRRTIRRAWLGDDGAAPGGARREDAVEADKKVARRRDERGEAGEELERRHHAELVSVIA